MNWDFARPNEIYFKELFRVSKNQIIWGANHFIEMINRNSPCWIMWDKKFSDRVSFAQFELAWTSFTSTCKKFDKIPQAPDRIHPTQKPIDLYKWQLSMFAKPGDKILDTHLGSGSSRIAAYELGFDFWGIEIDKDYFDPSIKRFEQYAAH